jgi:hypothetical protein
VDAGVGDGFVVGDSGEEVGVIAVGCGVFWAVWVGLGEGVGWEVEVGVVLSALMA